MSANIWKKCKLGSLGNAIIGLTYSPSNIVESGTLVLRSSNIQNECLSLEDNVYVNKKIPDEIRIKYNDILICVRNGSKALIGKSLLLKDECIGETFGAFMTVFRSEYAEYLAHVIKSSDIKRQIVRCTGATINQITNGDLRQFTLYFPTNKKERDNIARILSTCDTVIQNTQKTIDKYKAIMQGMMQDLFTRGLTKEGKLRPSYQEAPELYKESELGMIPKEWEIKTLGECSNKPEYGLNTPSIDYDGHIGYLRITDIDDNSHKFMKEGITSPLEYSEEYKLTDGDLVFARTGASVGKTYLYDSEDGNLYFAGFLIRFKILDSYCAKYIFYNTFLPQYKNWVICYSMRTGQPGVNAEEFSTFKLPMPLFEEQIAIANRLSSIDSTIQKEEAILKKYKNIKTGLMARLLTPPEDAEIIDETGE